MLVLEFLKTRKFLISGVTTERQASWSILIDVTGRRQQRRSWGEI